MRAAVGDTAVCCSACAAEETSSGCMSATSVLMFPVVSGISDRILEISINVSSVLTGVSSGNPSISNSRSSGDKIVLAMTGLPFVFFVFRQSQSPVLILALGLGYPGSRLDMISDMEAEGAFTEDLPETCPVINSGI